MAWMSAQSSASYTGLYMEDGNKADDELVSELARLRQRVSDMEALAVERRGAEEEARLRSAELASLLDAARVVASSLEIDQVMRSIMDSVSGVIPAADAQSIALYEATDGVLRIRFASGLERESVWQMALRPGQGLTGKAFQADQAQLYATTEEIARAQEDLSPENRTLIRKAAHGRMSTSAIAI